MSICYRQDQPGCHTDSFSPSKREYFSFNELEKKKGLNPKEWDKVSKKIKNVAGVPNPLLLIYAF